MLSLHCHRRVQQGVSLIETVVVMTVIVLLLATVMPSVSEWMRNVKVRNAAESVRNGMEIARMEALKRNGLVAFWLVSDSSSKIPGDGCALASDSPAWVVSVVDPSGACGAAPSMSAGPQLVQRSGASENADGLTVESLTSGGNAATQVMFNGLGQVQVGGSTIQTVDVSSTSGSARRLRVVVESGGSIRMCDRDVASNDPRVCPAL